MAFAAATVKGDDGKTVTALDNYRAQGQRLRDAQLEKEKKKND